jgi:hypothetical protein
MARNALGKGEVWSSILHCSTIPLPSISSTFELHGLIRRGAYSAERGKNRSLENVENPWTDVHETFPATTIRSRRMFHRHDISGIPPRLDQGPFMCCGVTFGQTVNSIDRSRWRC